MKKYIKYLALFISVLTTFNSCNDDSVYDIDWPVPVIESVSSYNALISSTITLTGNFTKVSKVSFGAVDGLNVKIAPDEKSLTVEVPRTMAIEGAPIKVVNEFKQSFQTNEKFIPVIPITTVTEVSSIQVGLHFTVKGENVDLLTEIMVDGKAVPIASRSVNTILVSVSGIDLKPGALANVSFKSLAKNTIPTAEKINVIYSFITYNEVIIWDFEDGTHQYVGEGTATVLEGNVLGKQEKYFSLRAPGYKWEKATGNMAATKAPDISSLVNPYITFAIRTPVGSKGYFELDMPNSWRHFGYGYDTDGQWIIISQPLEEKWEGNGWDLATFIPTLVFKAGDADTKQDLDIAYVKITEGKFDGSQQVGDALAGSTKPAKIVVMDFEDSNAWPNVKNGANTIASLNFRTNEINPFYGNKFFTYTDDNTLGGWGAYWGQTISKTMQGTDLASFSDPYLSFALNTIVEGAQYIIVRMYQYDEQLVMVQKFFPNTNGKWQNFQFSLFKTDMENWSDGSTTLGAHYKSLKRFNKDVPFDKIEIIVGRNGNNSIGISIDEMVITEGARY